METAPQTVPHRPDMGDWKFRHEIYFIPARAVDFATKFVPANDPRHPQRELRTVAFPIEAVHRIQRHEWYVPDVYGGRD